MTIFNSVGKDPNLSFLKFKKLSGYNLFEARVSDNGQIFRAVVGFIKPHIVVLVVFNKQSQKTPENIINTSLYRFEEVKLNLKNYKYEK